MHLSCDQEFPEVGGNMTVSGFSAFNATPALDQAGGSVN